MVIRRAEDAIRAGTVISLRRIVAVVAVARVGPVIVAAARVRLKAITASTSQAALAVNLHEVIWSRSHGVHDVRDEAISLSEVCRGCDYLPLSITETEGPLCECSVCSCQVRGVESWTVLGDDHVPVDPIERFLAYLTSIERSPNTVKAYAHDLKDWFTFLGARDLEWQSATLEDVAGYVAWLRLPPAAREGRVQVLPTVAHHCAESSVNRKLVALTSFCGSSD